MSWYLRTALDHDTHLAGELLDVAGEVTARCGVRFAPRPLAGHRGALRFPGDPPDPDQVCPRCKNSGGNHAHAGGGRR